MSISVINYNLNTNCTCNASSQYVNYSFIKISNAKNGQVFKIMLHWEESAMHSFYCCEWGKISTADIIKGCSSHILNKK